MNNTAPDLDNQDVLPEKIGSNHGWIVHPHYCPSCGSGQQFSNRCGFCGTPFSSSVAAESGVSPGNNRRGGGIPPAKTSMERGSASNRPFPAVFRKMSQRGRLIALSLLIVSLVSLVAGTARYRNHLQSRYMQNYVLALYGIKSGMDLAGRVCEGRYGEWKDGVSSKAPGDLIDPRSLADLAAVKDEIGEIMGRMGTPPVECERSAAKLGKLYSIYEGMNSLIINSQGALPLRRSEVASAMALFYSEIGNLKANLPAPLAEELKKAGQRYDLRFMGQGN